MIFCPRRAVSWFLKQTEITVRVVLASRSRGKGGQAGLYDDGCEGAGDEGRYIFPGLPSVIALCGRNPAGLRLYEAQGKAFQNGQANLKGAKHPYCLVTPNFIRLASEYFIYLSDCKFCSIFIFSKLQF